MKLFSFRGGIHPYDGKAMSKDLPITEAKAGKELVYPLQQHIGAMAKPVVSKGDRVLVGQKIAEAQGFVSASIYATVSGNVRIIEPRRTVSGNMVDSIVVVNDEQYEEVEYPKRKPWEELNAEEILGYIREAGIVGMGGAAFPTHVKLSPKDPQAIQYVIANCSECEPYLTSDYRRLMEEPERIVLGLNIVLKLFPNATGLFGVEDNKMDAAVKLRALTQDDPRLKVCICKSKYPQGAERQLIKALTGRELNSTKLPADVGCIVLNVDTLYSITRAVCEGRPLLHRIVTVTGDAIEKPQNFAVRIGTSYEELVEQAGGFAKEPVRIVSGGPMMGNALPDLKVPVMKASSALLCMTRDEIEQYSPTACIRCGRCLDACPERLMPTNLAELALRWDREGFLKLNGMECIECGSCSYVCPAGRRLAHAIKAVRRTIIEERRR